MNLKKNITYLLALIGLSSATAFATDYQLGVVNVTTCIMDSKYGKHEQEQLENIKKQWGSLIEETEKEIKDISTKFEDPEYLDGLSPEAEDELKIKYKTLQDDYMKYQNQLYQVMQQANYFFVQRMTANISKSSEKVAKEKKLNMVLNKEACFYTNEDMDVTESVVTTMNKDFEEEMKNLSANEQKDANPENADEGNNE
jgi:outer membrane protein